MTSRDEVVAKLAYKYNISKEEVVDIVNLYWKTIKDFIESLDFNKRSSAEIETDPKVNVRLIGIGTLKYNEKKKKAWERIRSQRK